MRTPRCVGLLAAACVVTFPIWTHAQTAPADDRLDRLEKKLDEIERRHQAELRARDEEIARLRAKVDGTPAHSTATRRSPESDLLSEIDSAGKPTTNLAAPPATALTDSAVRAAAVDASARNPLGLTRTPVSFNPDIAVVTDFRGSASTNNSNPARNRFDIGSVEIDFRAAVDPRADAVAIIPIARDVEDPLFYNRSAANGSVETGVEIEEAYLFLHDFGVPNLTAKVGRFHLRFGRQNILHSHDWPTFDNNFMSQSFLGPEALTDNGLSLSYVLPPKFLGGQYVEAVVEVVSGEGNNDEGPVFNNSAFVDGPAINTHLLWNADIARNWNLEIGTSFMSGKRNDDNQQSANLFGADFTLTHTDPTGRFNNQLFQAEATYGMIDTSRTDTQYAFGAYVLAQQQLNRDWYTGIRLDWTQNALNDQQEVWGVSPYITWYWNEFLRFRLEYQYKAGDVPTENNLYFQVTWIFGAHPPHPYWAMR